MKTSYIMRATKFIRLFVDTTHLTAKSRQNEMTVVQKMKTFNKATHRNVRFCRGATRFCFISSDYVVKWDINTSLTKEFGGCKDELEVYQIAKNEGMAYLLAEVTQLKYKGMDFYIMPRIGCTSFFQKTQTDLEELLTEDEYAWLMNNIYDIHGDNWGIRNNYPVIIDYACYVGG